ncbi:GGDEF domain-containing protein [Paenibacillus sp. YYML68]|uniref:GGDEF domain-containing protein n=1 Tax=Paenibacillus sp. YYML68 TaxID=2909250 RepID=UPI0024922168|nr:GGDEF domain-containing protein [Paenibacillus sp. YYML68]
MENRKDLSCPDSLYPSIVLHSPDWLWILDASGTPIGATPAHNRGQSLYRLVYDGDLKPLQEACVSLLEQAQPFSLVFRATLPNGSLAWLEAKGYPLTGEADLDRYAAIAARDITAYKHQEEKLTRLAYYDALTQLPNRHLFQDRFTQALHTCKRYNQKLALLYLDLDDFKQVNDRHGHAVGDELLRTVASRLSHSIREPDTASRIGGDEFVVLLQKFEQREDVAKVAARIAHSISQPYELNGLHLTITSSIGGAFCPDDSSDRDTLLQLADIAMYASKSKGKNGFQFYTDASQAEERE